MGAQFNSAALPILSALPVPLALAGALWLVWAVGGGLDIFGLLGMLMLIGLSARTPSSTWILKAWNGWEACRCATHSSTPRAAVQAHRA